MQASHTIFDRYHPAVTLAYCGVLLVFSMAVMQLVHLLLTFCGLFALEASLCGAKASLRNLAWQAPLVMALAIANPLFVSAGSTELFRIGMHAFYLESLVYGACQELMLANVLLAFSVASHIVTSDKVLCTRQPHANACAHDVHDHASRAPIRPPRQRHPRHAKSLHVHRKRSARHRCST